MVIMSDNVRWYIEMLGGLHARNGTRRLENLSTRKTAALLARLAYPPLRPHRREELMELLWPDDEPKAVQLRLRVALATLRKLFSLPQAPPRSIIISDHKQVSLNPEYFYSDIEIFDNLLENEKNSRVGSESISLLEQSMNFYKGNLLPEMDEEWVYGERERLASKAINALRSLANLYWEQNAIDSALSVMRRALQIDPFREENHIELMKLLIAAGQPATAIQQYEAFKRILSEQLNFQPSARITCFAEQIGSNSPQDAVLRSHVRHQERIPTQVTRFFGREIEISSLLEMLQPNTETHLLTLTGPGGVGKTRLALETIQQLSPNYNGRVWFIELSTIIDSDRLLSHLAERLGVRHKSSDVLLERVISFLAEKNSLLALDNFEQVAENGRDLVQQLLERTANLCILITSRRSLGLSSEREFPVNPLPCKIGEKEELIRLMELPSVKLFADRVQAVITGFMITPKNVLHIAKLCSALDGLPLAIELAASRSRIMSVFEIDKLLDNRLDLLVSRHSELEDRHKSMHAAIDWSCQLFSQEEMLTFKQLSVFRGGWNIAAAKSVCEYDSHSSCLEVLELLKADSMITSNDGPLGIRFKMLETIREYAWRMMDESELSVTRERHCRFYLTFAEEAWQDSKRKDPEIWLQRMDIEHENLIAALEYAQSIGDSGASLRFCACLFRFWWSRGYIREGAAYVERELRRGEPQDVRMEYAWAGTLYTAGAIAWEQGDSELAIWRLKQSLHIFQKGNSPSECAQVHYVMGVAFNDSGCIAEAEACFNHSYEILNELDEPINSARVLFGLGNAYRLKAQWITASSYYIESMAIAEKFGDIERLAWIMANMGEIMMETNRLEEAAAYIHHSLRLFEQRKDLRGKAYALGKLSKLLEYQGDTEQAQKRSEQSYLLFQQIGYRYENY